jgi:hypothetical protein
VAGVFWREIFALEHVAQVGTAVVTNDLNRRPSASGTRFTAPGISSSKLGQPQCDSNLVSDVYNGVSQRLQTYKPSALLASNSPVKGRSVPLCNMIYSSSGVRSFNFMVMSELVIERMSECFLSVRLATRYDKTVGHFVLGKDVYIGLTIFLKTRLSF